MVSVMSLWLPIVVSAVIVFIASAVIHMVLPFHRGDMKGLPNEAEILAALRKFNIPPGDYMFPYCSSMEATKSPEFIEKWNRGPTGLVTFAPPGPMSMKNSLIMWFCYSIVVSIFAGYVAGAAVGPGADYLKVFQFAGTTAFLGYAMALLQSSIWYRRNWLATFRSIIDGFVYALLTAGTFGWLWPA